MEPNLKLIFWVALAIAIALGVAFSIPIEPGIDP